MLYESKAIPKTPLGIISVPRALNEVPPAQHGAVVEELRKALCDAVWAAGQKTLGDLLEQLATNLATNSGDLTKVPKVLAQQINDACQQLAWQFEARDRFFEVRSRISEILLAQKP